MLKIKPVDDERQPLQGPLDYSEKCFKVRVDSPLDIDDGSNSIIDSVRALQGSPLCWPCTQLRDDEWRADRVLESLLALHERAVSPWEEFIVVPPPTGRGLGLDLMDATPDQRKAIYSQSLYGTFPAKIQENARRWFWELQTTSRFSVEDKPCKRDLEQVNLWSAPLGFKHVAGLAATVCIARVLWEFEETLAEWARVVCNELPGPPFEWLAQRGPARLEPILSAYLACDRAAEGERALRVATLVKSAEGWLALAESEGAKQEELVRVEAARKTQPRKAASGPRGKGKELTAQMVADYAKANPGKMKKTLVAGLMDKYKAKERTVIRRHKEAKDRNLMP